VGFEGAPAEILHGKSVSGGGEWIYCTPAAEFELRRAEVFEDRPYENATSEGVELLFVVESSLDRTVTLETNDRSWEMKRGQTMLIPHGTAYTIRKQGSAVFYKATTP